MSKRIKNPLMRSVLIWTSLLVVSLLVVVLEPVTSQVISKRRSPFSGDQGRIARQVHDILASENPRLPGRDRSDIAQTILNLAKQYDIDPLMILAIIKVESGFRPQVVSFAGAIGLMQVKPIVVREVEDEIKLQARPAVSLLKDPLSNIQVGVHYLSYLQRRFGQRNWFHVLSAYNMGPTYVGKLIRAQRKPSSKYYSKVMGAFRKYSRTLLAKNI